MKSLRSSDQFVMPAKKETNLEDGYNIYPSHKINQPVFSGYEELVDQILKSSGNYILDGFGGVYWDLVRSSIAPFFEDKGIDVNWINFDQFLKPEAEIDQLLSPSLGDDVLFGHVYKGGLADFFDLESSALLKPDKDRLNIVYGCGAALIGWECTLVYFDVPKNEIQFRSRAGQVTNLGARQAQDAKVMYKRFYFVDWVVLNKHKQSLIHSIDIIVDEQRPEEITWITGATLRASLSELSKNAFRARPWFEPGVWGGQWIKQHIKGLNNDVVNYAWSFELIAPENGIVLENEGVRLEVSIDMLLYHDNKAILGNAAQRFGYKFPIRFDFLDTIDGDNLSVQCHPTVAYTSANFGEDFTQDETYYILEATDDAKVYLGFQENIDAVQFRSELEESFLRKKPVEMEKYIQTFPSKKHDLFLIPNGTVHSSGKNNLVLEISATPYIFTFKMYDWLRPDLNGNPRTLNIDRAFENLNFDRKGKVVSDTLISRESLIAEGEDWQLLNLSTHPDHFYAIERFEFDTEINDITNNQCLILSLVEGESITVTTGALEQTIYYAETFIIPADAKNYTLKNIGKGRAKVVKAFVKSECC
jgi:mannose-6-phosphate isomerase class I